MFDKKNKIHYLYGGNPSDSDLTLRLGDFWALRLLRPTATDVLRECQYKIRKHFFRVICGENPRAALEYLQTRLREVVDHDDLDQATEFRHLAARLFQRGPKSPDDDDDDYEARIAVYESLLLYFPVAMAQPRENLIDLVASCPIEK